MYNDDFFFLHRIAADYLGCRVFIMLIWVTAWKEEPLEWLLFLQKRKPHSNDLKEKVWMCGVFSSPDSWLVQVQDRAEISPDYPPCRPTFPLKIGNTLISLKNIYNEGPLCPVHAVCILAIHLRGLHSLKTIMI